jgi:hypothetical protein
MTVAPCSLAIWIAAEPTPDPPAWTRTVSPGRTAARSTSICHAVRYTRGTAAASAHDRPAGLRHTFAAGTRTRSA